MDADRLTKKKQKRNGICAEFLFCPCVPRSGFSCLLCCRYSCISPACSYPLLLDCICTSAYLHLFLRVVLSSIFILVVHTIEYLASLIWKKNQNLNLGRKVLVVWGFFCSSLYCKGRRLIIGLDFLGCPKGHISRCGKAFN